MTVQTFVVCLRHLNDLIVHMPLPLEGGDEDNHVPKFSDCELSIVLHKVCPSLWHDTPVSANLKYMSLTAQASYFSGLKKLEDNKPNRNGKNNNNTRNGNKHNNNDRNQSGNTNNHNNNNNNPSGKKYCSIHGHCSHSTKECEFVKKEKKACEETQKEKSQQNQNNENNNRYHHNYNTQSRGDRNNYNN
jgi:hypothetical protein